MFISHGTIKNTIILSSIIKNMIILIKKYDYLSMIKNAITLKKNTIIQNSILKNTIILIKNMIILIKEYKF